MSGSRVHRLLRLINLMRSGQTLTNDELANCLGVSRRTVFRDLDMLERSGVPCRYDSNQHGYRIDEWYFLPPISLTLPEAIGLTTAAKQLAGPRSFPLHAEGARGVDKILQVLPAGLRQVCERSVQAVEVRWPAMSDVSAIRSTFLKLQEAAANQQKVRVTYDSYHERREIMTVLHPYVLALLNRAWYAVGHSEAHEQVRTFNLDRLIGVEVLQIGFHRPEGFSLESHFGQAWAMIPEGKIHRVRVRFLPKVAGNVEEVLWHPQQRTQRQADGSLVFEVEVDGLTEIGWWIMGYGDQAIVEKPAELRHRIRQMAEGILQHYAKTTGLTP